jgi:hypothetical protein
MGSFDNQYNYSITLVLHFIQLNFNNSLLNMNESLLNDIEKKNQQEDLFFITYQYPPEEIVSSLSLKC